MTRKGETFLDGEMLALAVGCGRLVEDRNFHMDNILRRRQSKRPSANPFDSWLAAMHKSHKLRA